MPTAIITDSIACLPPEVAKKYGIHIVPVNFLFEGKVYRDWVDVTPSQAYEMLQKNPQSFTTSPPSPEEFIKAFHKLGQRKKNILCITISSKLSTLYNMACIAKERVKQEQEGVEIEIIDSETAAGGHGLISTLAAKSVDRGATFKEVVETAHRIKERVKVFGVIETLRYAYRTGRIPKIASQIGSLLPVKPIFSVKGEVHFVGIARTKEQAIRRILDMMREKVGKGRLYGIISHAAVPEEGERLKERIASQFDCAEIWVSEFSPVMGYATGPGTLCLAFYTEE